MTDFIARVEHEFGTLTDGQKQGLAVIKAATDAWPLPHQAYALATAWHETGPSKSSLHMQPRPELGGPAYFKRYEKPSKIAAALGNTLKGDGLKFIGRGYVQITGRANYQKFSKVLGVDLVARPELALVPYNAVKILTEGMARGLFTGKALADYGADYVAMRRVINGTDRAEMIAGYARKFEACLGRPETLAGSADDRGKSSTALNPVPAQTAAMAKPARQSLWAWLFPKS